MNQFETSSHAFRKARTRTLLQIGGLVAKSGLLETFEISLGLDLQRDPEQKHQVAALFKGMVELNEMAKSEDVHLPNWSIQGLQLLGEGNREK
jgi:hypothetical protein